MYESIISYNFVESEIISILEEEGFVTGVFPYLAKKNISLTTKCCVYFEEEMCMVKISNSVRSNNSLQFFVKIKRTSDFMTNIQKIIDYHETIIYYFRFCEEITGLSLRSINLIFNEDNFAINRWFLAYTEGVCLDLSNDNAELICLIPRKLK